MKLRERKLLENVIPILERIQQQSIEEIMLYDVKNEWHPACAEQLRILIQNVRERVRETSRTEQSYEKKNQELIEYEKDMERLKGELTPWQKMCSYERSPDTVGTDCDASLRSAVIYWLAFELKKEKKIEYRGCGKYGIWFYCSGGEAWMLGGDTMNSYRTTVHNYIKEKDDSKILVNCDEHQKKISAAGMEFVRLNHTAGNFIPVALAFNSRGFNPSRDYWDLALACVYNYYMRKEKKEETIKKNGGDIYTLKWLVSTDKKVKACKAWLDIFQSWDHFVKCNFLQDFVDGTSDGYGKPKELWKDHFSGNVLPEEKQFEEFFANASEWILARGEKIATEVKKKLEEYPDREELARQMVMGNGNDR